MNKNTVYATLTIILLIVFSIIIVSSSFIKQYLFFRDEFLHDKIYKNDALILGLIWDQFLFFVRPLFIIGICSSFTPMITGNDLTPISNSNSNSSGNVFSQLHTIPDLEPNPDDERNDRYIIDYNGECIYDDIYGIIPVETSKLWKQQERIAEIDRKRRKKNVKVPIPEVRYS